MGATVMDEANGAKPTTADLERFLASFHRALQMQRKAVLNMVFRIQCAPDEMSLFPGANQMSALDVRTWLSIPKDSVILQSKHYKRLLETQDRLNRTAQPLAANTSGATPRRTDLAAFLQQTQLLWQQADRLISSVTSSMTDVDELTGLLNRRAMERDLGDAIDNLKTSEQGTAVGMVDADHFKRVNDELGHTFGDLVLETLATRFEESLRNQDRVYRYGGEEFLVLMPETTAPEAQAIMDRLRQEAFAQDISDGVNSIRISVSAGVTQLAASDDMAAVLQRADQALYKAKDSGRNCVVVA
jgi:diguanylate cyclase